MKETLLFVLVLCLAILVLGVAKLLKDVNKRLLAGDSISGGRFQPRGSNRFPLIPTTMPKLNGNDQPCGCGLSLICS